MWGITLSLNGMVESVAAGILMLLALMFVAIIITALVSVWSEVSMTTGTQQTTSQPHKSSQHDTSVMYYRSCIPVPHTEVTGTSPRT